MTQEELDARPAWKLDPAIDGVAINLNGTRFEGQNVANDPNFVNKYYEGLNVLQQRKASGQP
jgi:hypothetical protein